MSLRVNYMPTENVSKKESDFRVSQNLSISLTVRGKSISVACATKKPELVGACSKYSDEYS